MKLLAIISAALLVCSCAGHTNEYFPIRTEAASPAAVSKDKPLHEFQVDLVALLGACLERANNGLNSSAAESPWCEVHERNVSAKPGLSSSDYFAALSTQIAAVDTLNKTDTHGHDLRVVIRNSVESQLVAASITNCSVYLDGLRTGQITTRTLADIFATGFGLAGGLARPTASAHILSALAAFSTASGASVDRNIFAQQGVELVADQIVKTRDKEAAALNQKRSQTYDQWSLGDVLGDVARFHMDCSLLRGLASVQDAVRQREASVAAIRSVQMQVAAGELKGTDQAAVLKAVTDAFTSQLPSTPAAASSEPPSLDLSVDIDPLVEQAKACIDAVAKRDTKGATADALSTAEPTCAASSDWKASFSNAGLGALGTTPDVLAPPTITSPEAQNLLAKAKVAIDTAAVVKLAGREAAVAGLRRLVKDGGDIVTVLALVRQPPSPAPADPLLAVMQQAVETFRDAKPAGLSPPEEGRLAAQLALSAAQGYLAAVRPKASA